MIPNDRLAERLFCITVGAGSYACYGGLGVALFCVGFVIGHGLMSFLAR